MVARALFVAIFGFLYNHIVSAADDCKPGTWVSLTSIPVPRQEQSTFTINSTTIAVLGGTVPSSSGLYWRTTNPVELYDIESDLWRQVAPIPIRVNHPNVQVKDGKVYLLGALVNRPDVDDPKHESLNWVATPLCYMYDPASDAWASLESMPPGTERGSSVTGVYGELRYVAAGMTVLQDTYQDAESTVTAFNTTAGAWQRVAQWAANIPGPRQHTMGGVIGDYLYVVGGRTFSQLDVRGQVFELNLKDIAARGRTSPHLIPVPRGGLCGDSVGSTWYTFGGEGDRNTKSVVWPQTEAYDVRTEKWTKLTPMQVPRHGTHAVAIGNKIYIPGGGLQQDGKKSSRIAW